MSEKKILNKKPKFLILCVLDGWGVYQTYAGNAINLAKKPFFDSLISKYPSTTLKADGEVVGLPWGDSGNSEVGHLSLGGGRIFYQDLPRINKTIGEGAFYKNKELLGAVEHVKKHNSKLHIMGLVSNGAVHSSIDHLHALLILVKQHDLKDVYIHAFLDGRDTPYNSGLNFINGIQYTVKDYGVGVLATINGRFYAMDRNNNWDRTAKSYLAMCEGVGNKSDDPVEAIKQNYKKRIYDEEFPPTVITKDGQPITKISDNDAVIFFNYRADRARQITKAFVSKDFNNFKRPKCLDNLYYVCFTEYEKDLGEHIAFPTENAINCLGEVLAKDDLTQLRIAETEKYAHVTYFFNGGNETKSKGEEHILVPSLAIPSYDMKPEMSAPEITKKLLEEIPKDKYDFILVNYANSDMVGHTGNQKAAIAAIETLDKQLEKLIKAVLENDGLMLITADHGNAEMMFNMQTGQIDKEHTANPVPFLMISKELEGKNIGWPDVPGSDLSLVPAIGILADVAPTVLKIMEVKQPNEMTGRSLI